MHRPAQHLRSRCRINITIPLNMARQAAIQSRLKTRDVVRCERYRRPIHKRRRRTGAEPTKFAWREFMRAHLSWYQSNSAYRGYQEIWKHVGSIDWAALPHEHRNWYALLAVKGGQLPDETAPPRAVNNFALPSLLIHEPQNSDWRWDDPGDFAQRTNPTGLRVLHEVPSDRFPLFVEPIDGTSEGSLLTPVRMAWKRVRHLGKGALGSVDLWIKYDLLTFEIYDRVALKTTSFNESPEKRAHWADPDRWTDYPHVPAEVAAIRTLNKEPRCPYISQYRGFRVFARHRAYRILTPVAEFGNLESLLKGWAVEVGENGLERRKDDAETLPASFVFDIFAALVIGAQHMIASNILHNDIKLENILLFDDTEERCMREFALPGPDEGSENASAEDEDEQDEEDEDEEEEEEVEAEGWGAKPVFTDFGLCTPMTSTRLFRNPDRLRWRGTPVYRPPEQLTHPVEPSLSIIQGQDEREPISEKASVFSIGVSIFHVSFTETTTDSVTLLWKMGVLRFHIQVSYFICYDIEPHRLHVESNTNAQIDPSCTLLSTTSTIQLG